MCCVVRPLPAFRARSQDVLIGVFFFCRVLSKRSTAACAKLDCHDVGVSGRRHHLPTLPLSLPLFLSRSSLSRYLPPLQHTLLLFFVGSTPVGENCCF